ncbi:Bug family tripartite tricarboxylate transporter substrate binding protein [Verminephrobacter eiseniae]|uniref:Bug family tripartite tricarboxylate transporter substrate binding protein n=1 Tax=Verminephrobacter eiseniae TaxID=364317 RepID=UPI00223868F0|nr:tripartite tricarboxylate transporter substrate binding protein [Verminephrobacter eiseniae]MCW5233969.1 tripartite tricarboxylate transporter substrate binding protein [Verminephrobacter eiseniae]MCW5294475.1 tripartite tricarboxylate transporter substrate binding protein [Verminephrobacter eiseniae]MCW8187022.1 tripartite tricarboxylate transporter substrate binding protein [Verminephrobacter eiseniae]MCW8225445.1 tripartite tricarboxylate transporter substrate binding protein [Verminephro
METTKRRLLLALAGMAVARPGLAQGQAGAALPAFPTRTIRIVVPFTPGSGADNSARYFGERLATQWGQAVVVENRPGANGIIALQAVKHAPADGYTLLLASNSPLAVNPLVIKDLGYDPVKDYKPLSGLARSMNAIVVANDSPLATLEALLAAAKAGPLTVGTYSAGYHLAAAWLAQLAGCTFSNVPYKGQAPIMTDVIGRQIDFAQVDLGGAMPLLKAGKLRALAVSGETRNPDLPGVPTVREKGFDEYVQYSWTSFYVHAQTPAEVAGKLAAALQKTLATEESRAFVRKTGGELMPYPPEQMQRFLLEEIARFRKIAAIANIRPE